MLPDRVSNPGPLTYESGALPIALRGPANCSDVILLSLFECTDFFNSFQYSFGLLDRKDVNIFVFCISKS